MRRAILPPGAVASTRCVTSLRRGALGLLMSSAAVACLVVLPAVAQAKEAKPKSLSRYSEEKSSLCVYPKDGSIFSSPEVLGLPNFAPLEKADSHSTPFPDEGSACGESEITHPIVEGGEKGGASGFKYNGRALYESKIAGAQWATAFTGAKSGNHPAYYIYDAEFNTECTKGATIKGQFAADNAAGVFLNGHWIGEDEMAESTKNFEPKPYPDPSITAAELESYFVAGRNVLQFVVIDTTGPYTGIDFSAHVKYGPCPRVLWKNGGTEEKKVQTVSSGTLTFTTTVGVITCKKSDAGNIWNPTEGNGLDETILFDLYECSSPECPNSVTVTAAKLPWSSELVEEAAIIRDKSTGMELAVNCEGHKVKYHGELEPKFVNAAKKTWAFDEFDEGAGTLTSGSEGTLKIGGKDLMAGFLAFEALFAEAVLSGQGKTEKLEEKAAAKAEAKVTKELVKLGPIITKEEAAKAEQEAKEHAEKGEKG